MTGSWLARRSPQSPDAEIAQDWAGELDRIPCDPSIKSCCSKVSVFDDGAWSPACLRCATPPGPIPGPTAREHARPFDEENVRVD